MDKKCVFVIDDEKDFLENCLRLITKQGYGCLTESDPEKAIERIGAERPDIVLTDLKMPKKDGIEVLKEAKKVDPEIIVILLTGYATVQSAVEAIKEGAFDYIQKPFSADQLRVVIERALNQKKLLEENRNLKLQLETAYSFENIIGTSVAIKNVLEVVKKVARSEANILILGESGTGKELIARSIHTNSNHFKRSFVPVDCASLPENLLESELFGHEKGSFTGAHITRPGLLEFANDGTLFLDEIGDISLNLQGKLLRALQEKNFRRIGGRKLIDVNFRVISATNKDLREAIKHKEFREELYYRINVITINLPPLRERLGDIPLIAYHYLRHFANLNKKNISLISPEAMRLFENFYWPGNVRELQNVIERAISFCDGDAITVEDLPEYIKEKISEEMMQRPEISELEFKKARSEWLEVFEKNYLMNLLKKCDYNISKAAKLAAVDRKSIHRWLKKYKMTMGIKE
ncbi:MAG: sigma-54-dependent Fis family transcriptional regulator [Nitrospirae bacterium]|nr:sigma-54-dependent Fis family transcriptional regulator [Nitrospirota bacterium]